MSRPARLVVRVTPRAAADRIDGWAEGADGRPYLKVRTRAAPVDGEANAALQRMVARALGVRPSAVTLAAGGSARLKTLAIEGLDEAAVRLRLASPAAAPS